MKTILIPTDFSNNAYCALYYAAKLFQDQKIKFIIYHSFEDQVTNLTSRIDIGKTEAVVEELYETYESKCNEVKHKIVLDTENPNHTYEVIATSLSLSRATNKLIEKENAFYVVMGSKGATEMASVFMGSNTLSLISSIKKAALLIIPKELDYKPIDVLGFATGFKRSYTKKELAPLMYIAALNKASVKVLHIHKEERLTDAQQANFEHLLELLEEYTVESNWLSEDIDNYEAISSHLTEENVDMLAMIYYKHNAIVRFFREATVKNIAKYTQSPFLVLPKRD
ncbi:universal stress protein [Ulvibacter litoralis]|uniref:Nucleotide-binding universal stress protein, UspA family n=1 Tax=Ulvibacter litoralis TaxID=227084 RepID=A0A1G7I9X5_9FLAO|nr:universal stress protein [Ulvibacter litoralis]GHC62051.1 hypothetical protein GCM10008083_28920 [Ulvibacter litoralis]SDF09393.1 Nucleotide-binding universal stress protein, UspA family [Ulvibacter litoralis]